jgi:CRP-like cAMP-binding protein/ferredoxin-NADP reductase
MSADTAALFGSRLFAHLDDAGRDHLLRRGQERRFDPGQLIVREGTPATCVYVVLEGSVRVVAESEVQETPLARLGAGEHFGEQALLPGRGGLRSATVRAAEPTRVMELPGTVLAELVRDRPELNDELVRMGEDQVLNKLARRAEALRLVSLGRRDLEELGHARFEPGQLLFREGDPSDRLYVLISGEVEVTAGRSQRRLRHKLTAGQCVGELGLLHNTARSASVRALTLVEALTVDRAAFERLGQLSPDLHDHVHTLRRCHALQDPETLARAGFVSQYAGAVDGRACVSTAYRFDDGRFVVASLLSASGDYHLEVEPRGTTRRLEAGGGIGDCALELCATEGGERIVGARISGDWPDLALVHKAALDQRVLSGEDLAAFELEGRLRPPDERRSEDPNLLCGCMRVSRARALEAILGGCEDLDQLGEATGCGSVCGGCRPRALQLLGRSDCLAAALVGKSLLTPEVCSLRLRPARGPLPFQPGQHLLVEGFIGGHWVRRPYTLTSSPQAETYEICVKREAGGIFSPWLHELEPGVPALRISEPRGEPIRLPERGRLVCLVAGVGVTPAAGLIRSRGPGSVPCLVHYSASSRPGAPLLEELEELARRQDALELVFRDTGAQGRLSPAALSGFTGPGTRCFLCGPPDYVEAMRAGLLAAGVSPEDIQAQAFTPVTEPPRTHPPLPRGPSRALKAGLLLLGLTLFALAIALTR